MNEVEEEKNRCLLCKLIGKMGIRFDLVVCDFWMMIADSVVYCNYRTNC